MLHPTPILLMEGLPSVLYRRVEPAILGLQFWCARQGVAVMFSTGVLASAGGIVNISKKVAQEHGLSLAAEGGPPAGPAGPAPQET